MHTRTESPKYPHLFSPLTIAPVTIRNRLMQTAHGKLATRDGGDSRRTRDYHVARAQGGIGLIITGNRLVHPTSANRRMSVGYLKRNVVIDRELTKAVHAHGATIFAQLNHFGLNLGASDNQDDLRVLWAPSAIGSPVSGEMAKEMEPADIWEVVEGWALSAELSREGGFDGVEVHMAHTYLLHEFLSPLYNHRVDEFGGSFSNRLRFAVEVIRAVRQRVGRDFVVGVRISLSDFMEGGLDVEDAVRVAQGLEADGEVDYINVTAGGYHNIWGAMATADVDDGWLLEMVARVKTATERLPVFAVGGIKDPALGEALIADGRADMIAMTRAQIADPELATKAQEGREDEIYHCIRANQGCLARAFRGLPIACTVNPAAMREGRFGDVEGVARPGTWLVIGGGPAGMKAAETLAKRGHDVTLMEQSSRLGGQLNLIVKTPGRESFSWITKDLDVQMRKHGVDILLETEATYERVLALAPDGVIVATGAVPDRSGYSSVAPLVRLMPGADRESVLTVWDVLDEQKDAGDAVLVVDDDGTRYTAGVAEVLLDVGKQVEIVSRFNALFPTTAQTLDMAILYRRLFEKGLRYRLNSWVREIGDHTVTVYNLFTGQPEELFGIDTVVLATAPRANDALYLALKGQLEHVYRVGDCVAPRRVDHAIYEGYLAGLELWDNDARYIIEGDLERWDDREIANATVR